MMADSESLFGANPLFSISVRWTSFQSLLFIKTEPFAARNSRSGSARRSVRPNCASDGPIARMATFLEAFPVMMKPPINASSPVSTRRRVEMLSSREGPEGVGVGVGVAVGTV
jgi:hypothetical protein